MRANVKWLVGAGAALVVALLAVALWQFGKGSAEPAGERRPGTSSAAETAKRGKRRAEQRRRETAESKAQGDAPRSQILTLENIAAGEHSVMARLDGYQDVARKITIKANGTGQLFLSLPRVFTPDTEIETIRGIYRGVLVKKDFFGAITIETSPGVEQTFKPEDIRKVTPISK